MRMREEGSGEAESGGRGVGRKRYSWDCEGKERGKRRRKFGGCSL